MAGEGGKRQRGQRVGKEAGGKGSRAKEERGGRERGGRDPSAPGGDWLDQGVEVYVLIGWREGGLGGG